MLGGAQNIFIHKAWKIKGIEVVNIQSLNEEALVSQLGRPGDVYEIAEGKICSLIFISMIPR